MGRPAEGISDGRGRTEMTVARRQVTHAWHLLTSTDRSGIPELPPRRSALTKTLGKNGLTRGKICSLVLPGVRKMRQKQTVNLA